MIQKNVVGFTYKYKKKEVEVSAAKVYGNGNDATYIDRSLVARNYCPRVRYYFLHNQASFFIGGRPQTADIDSNGNIYIIYSNKKIKVCYQVKLKHWTSKEGQ